MVIVLDIDNFVVMETITINIPENKSAVVKQILKELGVTILKANPTKRKPSDYIGTIPNSKAKQFLSKIDKNREEWERDI